MKENNAMEITSLMQFKGYDVLKLEYKKNIEEFKADVQFKMAPSFKKSIEILDEKNFNVTLGCKIESNEDEPFPFDMKVVIEGHFYISNVEGNEQLINENSLAILFPYLRATISMITSSANINALILPTINIINLFKQLENEELEENQNNT